MTYYHIQNIEGDVLFSNLPENLLPILEECSKENQLITYKKKKFRCGKIQCKNNTVFVASSSEDLTRTSRVFKEKLYIYKNYLSVELPNIKREIISSVLHDITKLNGYCSQDLYEIIPESVGTKKSHADHIHELENFIKKNSNKVAKTIFNINKNISRIKAECSFLKKRFGHDKLVAVKNKHQASQAIMPTINTYQPHLKSKGVEIEIDPKNSKIIEFDFNLFEGALVPFFDNILKYIFPKSKLFINFIETTDGFIMVFDMISLQIKKEEQEQLFRAGYSGENAVKYMYNGRGEGMLKISELLNVNDAEMKININVGKKIMGKYKNAPYERNVFQIVFNNQ